VADLAEAPFFDKFLVNFAYELGSNFILFLKNNFLDLQFYNLEKIFILYFTKGIYTTENP